MDIPDTSPNTPLHSANLPCGVRGEQKRRLRDEDDAGDGQQHRDAVPGAEAAPLEEGGEQRRQQDAGDVDGGQVAQGHRATADGNMGEWPWTP
jgi:hypothetical protein